MPNKYILNISSHLKTIRHLKVWNTWPIWKYARLLYQFAADPFGRGIERSIGYGLSARVPREFFDYPFETYEPQNITTIVDFINKNQKICVLDVGSSTG